VSRRVARARRLAQRAFERAQFKRATEAAPPAPYTGPSDILKCECGELVTRKDGHYSIHVPKNTTRPCERSWPARKKT
jgi:hypothetical protein